MSFNRKLIYIAVCLGHLGTTCFMIALTIAALEDSTLPLSWQYAMIAMSVSEILIAIALLADMLKLLITGK